MSSALQLRSDFDAARVRHAAQQSKDCQQVRRLHAIAAIYDGATRSEAAKIGGVTLQVVRDWVLKFNGEGPTGLIDRKAPGRPSRLNDEHRAALAELIEAEPIPAIHGVARWRLIDLCQRLNEEFGVSISKQTLSKEVKTMGYCMPSHHPRIPMETKNLAEFF